MNIKNIKKFMRIIYKSIQTESFNCTLGMMAK